PGTLHSAHGSPQYDDARRISAVDVSAVSEYRSPLLDRPGAVDATEPGPDSGVPLHHGDPFGEQRAAADGVVVVDRSHRDVLTIGGAERLTWLDGFISQHVADLPNGSGGETLVLDPNGRVEHHAVLSDVDGTLVVDTEPRRGEALVGVLARMVLWADASPEPADLAVLTRAGPRLPGSLTAPDGTRVELPVDAYASIALPGGGIARRMPWPQDGSVDLVVPRPDLSAW